MERLKSLLKQVFCEWGIPLCFGILALLIWPLSELPLSGIPSDQAAHNLVCILTIFSFGTILSRLLISPPAQEMIGNRFFFLFPMFIFTGIWLSGLPCIWPGTDSIVHYEQAQKAAYTDAHPPLYSMVYSFCLNIWDYPGSIIVLQILYASFVIFSCSMYLVSIGVKRAYIILFCLLISFAPSMSFYVCSVVKDTFYNLLILHATVALLRFVQTYEDKITVKISQIIELICVFTLIVLFRHNGIFASFFGMLVASYFLFRQKQWKKACCVLLLPMICIGGFKVISSSFVQPSPWTNRATNVRFYTTINAISLASSILHQGYALPKESQEFITQFGSPEALKQSYFPGTLYPLPQKLNSKKFQEYLEGKDKGALSCWFQMAKAYPLVALQTINDNYSIWYQINPKKIYTKLPWSGMLRQQLLKNPWDIQQEKASWLVHHINAITSLQNSTLGTILFWRVGLWLLVLGCTFIRIVQKKRYAYFAAFVPVLFSHLSVVIFAHSPPIRYVLSTIFVSFFTAFIVFKDKPNLK